MISNLDNSDKFKPATMLPGIFFCSLAAISFEIALTRIFSISLWYHFAFMVVSIAMLGIGLSGTVLSLYPGLKKQPSLYALFLAVAIPSSYMLSNLIPFDPVRLSWDSTQILYIGIYYILLCIPFFFFGLLLSAVFFLFSEKSGLIYGFDLLGAGTGSIAVILLMHRVGPEQSVFLISLAALLGAFIMGRRKSSLAIAALILLILALNPDFIHIRMSQYKGLQLALKYPGARPLKTYHSSFSRVDVFESPMVRFAPGLSLNYLDELPHQIGLSIDGSDITAITEGATAPSEKGHSLPSLKFLMYLPSALPYEVSQTRFKDMSTVDVLIIEPKGGLPVLLAREYRAKNIYKIESNPLIVDVIRKDFREFSGNIYGVNTWKGFGRSWLKSTEKSFDIIDISLMGAMPSGLFGISEDYRFTVEAFKQYLSHLKADGVLSLSLFILPPPRTDLRLLNTVIRAMEETGIKDTDSRIAAVRSWGSIHILIKASPFSHKEISAIKEFSRQRNFDIIYYPGVKEEETNIHVKTPSNEYYKAFKKIINDKTRGSFKNDYLFDITEVYDDNPFFHHHLKLKNIREIYRLMGRKWQYFIEEGYLLPAVFIQAVLLSLILLFLPAVRGKIVSTFKPARVLAYFAFLGLGFMFIEVPLIQKAILPLENPSYAVAVVLASVLISSGAGSLLSQRWSFLRSPYTVLALAVLIIPYGLLLSPLMEAVTAYPLLNKIMFIFGLILPLGFLMGIPFPLVMRLLPLPLIPWAWAVNGCFSVLAPVLAVMLAMTVGFKWVFLTATVMYTGGFVVLKEFYLSD